MPNKLNVNKKHLTFALPLELLARVDHAAKERKMTRTEFVWFVLERELRNIELTADEYEWIAATKRANEARRQVKKA